jgi:DNA-directed RNA polymerase specialized sigma24 family protein
MFSRAFCILFSRPPCFANSPRLKRAALAKKALDKLTEIQRRRYLMYHVEGMATRKIADIEGV